VFYSINVWDPRKAIRDLVTAFGRTFSGHDKVTLVLKTSTWISELSLESASGRRIPEYVEALLDEVSRTTGRPAPNVVTIAADGLAGRVIDALHGLGDCFVSLTHGEGWGMGAFDAATLGNPVLITGYGGPEEYFASDYPGLIPYTLETVSGWVPQASFRPPQCWHAPIRWRSTVCFDAWSAITANSLMPLPWPPNALPTGMPSQWSPGS
jgi:glycosyltransferase involved in cell wall biosynthesis